MLSLLNAIQSGSILPLQIQKPTFTYKGFCFRIHPLIKYAREMFLLISSAAEQNIGFSVAEVEMNHKVRANIERDLLFSFNSDVLINDTVKKKASALCLRENSSVQYIAFSEIPEITSVQSITLRLKNMPIEVSVHIPLFFSHKTSKTITISHPLTGSFEMIMRHIHFERFQGKYLAYVEYQILENTTFHGFLKFSSPKYETHLPRFTEGHPIVLHEPVGQSINRSFLGIFKEPVMELELMISQLTIVTPEDQIVIPRHMDNQ